MAADETFPLAPWLLLITTSLAFLMAPSLAPAADEVSPSPAGPLNWLYLPDKSIVLRVRHEKLRPECRNDAAEFVQTVFNEFVRADYTIQLEREFVESEVAYYRANLTNENRRATAEGVVACLDASLKAGALDWDCLRAVHLAAPDSAAVTRNLPWLHLLRDHSQIRLADRSAASLPMLELAVRWSVRPVQGTSVSSVNIRGVKQPALTTTYSGTTHLSNLDVTLRPREKGATLFERHYPEESWKRSYVGPWETPFYVIDQRILLDLRAGLKAPPPSPDPKKKKKGK
jgi:hypothetical protein